MPREDKQIIWVSKTEMQLSGTRQSNPLCVDVDTTLSSTLINTEGFILNGQKEFDPTKPPKYIWFKHKERHYNINFHVINAFYSKYSAGLFLYNQYEDSPLAQEILDSTIACERLIKILVYYGFIQVHQSAILNMCKYSFVKGTRAIVYQSDSETVEAITIPTGQSKKRFDMHTHTLRLLSYIETKYSGNFYDNIEKLEHSIDLWNKLEIYIRSHKKQGETFDFLPKKYLNDLKRWHKTEIKQIAEEKEEKEEKNGKKKEELLSQTLLRIITYHKTYKNIHKTWLFDHFDPNPLLDINPTHVQYKKQILAQTERGGIHINPQPNE